MSAEFGYEALEFSVPLNVDWGVFPHGRCQGPGSSSLPLDSLLVRVLQARPSKAVFQPLSFRVSPKVEPPKLC